MESKECPHCKRLLPPELTTLEEINVAVDGKKLECPGCKATLWMFINPTAEMKILSVPCRFILPERA